MSDEPTHHNPSDLQRRLAGLTVRDRHQLQRRLDRARRERDPAARRAALEALEREVAASEQRVERRRRAVPVPRYPADLPITERREEILGVLARHPVVIVSGETGSGKSTQLPKMCLELGRGVQGLIGHTQPRRLAARAVAERVAEELGGEVGGVVGYAVRFTDRVGEGTLVKLMTDGILLAEIQRDRNLSRYDTLIVDEAHERSLNIDFILGYLKRLLPRRPDLKVVVTSATIDTERFSRHFDDAPIVEVSGRTYAVEIAYRPLVPEDADPDDPESGARDQTQAICDATLELCARGPGDILVFLSGEREIRDTAEALGTLKLPHVELLPLYARLSAAEQHRIFQPHDGRRIVLATNVAETSLTVPGIHYVIDPGTARISRYSRRTKVQRLPIEPVSRASADQRAGRCGRVAPGVCVRLYTEEDLLARPPFTEPEILRTNLASVILQMTALGLGDVAAFPFVDAPDPRNIKDGVALLEELGALEPGDRQPRRLTPIGRRLAQLPLDPRLGRMVLEAERHGCLHEVMVVAAALSIQDPRERPPGHQPAAAEAHARFAHPDSDFLSYLRLWDHLQEQQEALSSNQFRKLCRAEFLHYLRIREWQDIHAQLRQVARGLGLHAEPGRAPSPEEAAGAEGIHRSLLAGLLSHLGLRSGPRQDYQGARNARFAIVPDSVLFRRPPPWVMAAELVETNRMWARVVARIQPEWAEDLAPHLVQRSYGEPQWQAERGAAFALERVTLFGLPIVTGRKVDYARVDAAGARELFIREALVEGNWPARHAVLEDNRRLVDQVRALEDRARRRDILVGDDVLVDFYERRLPPEVTSGHRFDRWWRKERLAHPDLLRFTLALLVRPEAGDVSPTAYPDQWTAGDLALPLRYGFEPGSESDGVTVDVPLPALERVSTAGLDWGVPGMREELVTALIRSLPKDVRRNLIPAAEHARAFLERRSPEDGPLLETLAAELSRRTGQAIGPDSWQLGRVPEHLLMAFRVTDETGGTVARGRDLDALRHALRGRSRAEITRAARSVERAGLQSWSFGTLPRSVEVAWHGHHALAYLALVDEGDSVAIRALTTEEAQERVMVPGTRRLLRLTLPSPVGAARRLLAGDTKLALALAPHGSVAALLDDCVEAAIDHLVAEHGGPVWDEAGFVALQEAVNKALVDTVVYAATVVAGVLVVAGGVGDRLASATAPALGPSVADLRAQLARLVHPGFVAAAGVARLPDLLRYLRAMERRLDKLTEDVPRDRRLLRQVHLVEERYRQLVESRPPGRRRAVEHVAWMIEELRVSLFAQALGTPRPVSEPRILREIARLTEPA